MLCASFFIMGVSGSGYVFGSYSEVIKSTQGYDQSTLNLLGFFKDLGGNLGAPIGLIGEITPPWLVLLIGAGLNFAGYFMIWLVVTGKIFKPPVWQVCLYIAIGVSSQNFANTGIMTTCVKNFPESRGTILGVLKGYLGLSGAIVTQFYLAIYGNDSESLILLAAWLPAVVPVVFACVVRFMKDETKQSNEGKLMNQFLLASVVLATFIMAMIIVQKQVVFSKAAYAGSVSVICILLTLPLFIAVRQELSLRKIKKKLAPSAANEAVVEEPHIVEPKESPPTSTKDSNMSWFGNIFNKPERGEDHTILQALVSIDMLLLLTSSFVGYGTNVTVVDNLGQIGKSLGYTGNTVKSFVSLVSIWNYFGRVLSGLVSEILLRKYKVPRPMFLAFSHFVTCIGHLLIVFPTPGSVYFASVIIGFAFGVLWPMFYALSSELFGLKYYSTIQNCVLMVIPIGSYLLNVKVTGSLYDREAIDQLKRSGKERLKGSELTCIGTKCYKHSLLIMASLSFFAGLTSLVFAMRTRKFYKSDIYKKFTKDATTAETELTTTSVIPCEERRVNNGGVEH